MKQIKVSEASGVVLNWLVAKCDGHNVAIHNTGAVYLVDTPWKTKPTTLKWIATWQPSEAWAQGGPIIDKFKPQFIQSFSDRVTVQRINGEGENFVQHGPTLLIAAMRCYVVSKLGETVEIPEELT